MRRVLHISANRYPPLDTFHFTRRTWVELAKEADEYHVMARGYDNRFRHFREGNLFLHLVPSLGLRERSFLVSSFYMFILIKRFRINRLLAQSPLLGGLTAALASRWFNIPLMVELHGQHYLAYFSGHSITSRLASFFVTFTLRASARIRALNALMGNRLQQLGFQKVSIVHNRVDTTLFSPPKEDYTISGAIRLISVGRYVWEKNYLKLIQSLATWQRPWQLTLIGGGPLAGPLERAAEQLGVTDKIHFISWLPQADLANQLRTADIYIQSSVSEALPRTLLEAMAIGLPCVSTDAGYIAGTLRDGENGLVVSTSLAELHGTLSRLADDPILRKKIGQRARADVMAEYEWGKCFQQYRDTLYGM